MNKVIKKVGPPVLYGLLYIVWAVICFIVCIAGETLKAAAKIIFAVALGSIIITAVILAVKANFTGIFILLFTVINSIWLLLQKFWQK